MSADVQASRAPRAWKLAWPGLGLNGRLLLVPWIAVAVLCLLVVPPLVVLFLSSVKDHPDKLLVEGLSFTLQNYRSAYLSRSTYELIFNTLTFSIGSMALGFTLSVAIAWLLERTNVPLRRLCLGAILVPLAIPGMITAMTWVMLLSPRQGSINIVLRQLFGLEGPGPINIYSMGGMIFVESINIIPTAVLMLSVAFRRMDPSLEEASAICGRGVLATLRHVTLPLMKPALLAAAIFFFIIAFEAFEIPGVLGLGVGIHVLSTRIYWLMHPEQGLPHYGAASSLAMLSLVMALGLIWLYQKQIGQSERFQVVSGKAFRPHRIDLGKWRIPALLFLLLVMCVSVVLPVLALIWGSLFKYSTPFGLQAFHRMGLSAYRSVLGNASVRVAAGNTLIVSVVTATALMALVTVTSWVAIRSRMRVRRAVDVISFLPQAIPSAVIALALMIVFLAVPIPIYGTVWIIVLALMTRYLAFGSRTMNAAQVQIHRSLEEASSVAGAGWVMTHRRILLPLLLPAIANGWIWVAVHAARELTASLMLYSPNSIVLPTLIWSMWEDGSLPEACVLGLALVLALGAITWVASWLLGKKVLTSW